jgi:glyoxylase-like metal-dependent hydrolase (beta-lactamase superfamily II)
MRWNGFEIEKIYDIFYVVKSTQSANIGICAHDNAALVIDSGQIPDISVKIIDAIRQNTGCEVELLFNTHYHADHTFGNQSFDCPILSSTLCRDTMKACLTTHWTEDEIDLAKKEDPGLSEAWKDLRITFPTKTFDTQLEYDFHGIRIIFQRIGGHSPDSSMAFFPDFKLVFAGDVVFGGLYPTLLDHDGNPFELVNVLQQMNNMDVNIIIPGHGDTCDKSMVQILINYWICLMSICRRNFREGQSKEEAITSISKHCRLHNITFHERKHLRNISTVWKYLTNHIT